MYRRQVYIEQEKGPLKERKTPHVNKFSYKTESRTLLSCDACGNELALCVMKDQL